jgi:hypothetical protein
MAAAAILGESGFLSATVSSHEESCAGFFCCVGIEMIFLH